MSRWKELFYEGLKTAPSRPGCYVFYLDGVPAYVGQSGNIRRRLKQHFRDVCPVTGWWSVPWPPGHADSLYLMIREERFPGERFAAEKRLIGRMANLWNVVGVAL